MALIKCKECGTEVSSKAETCPKCGARVAAKPMGCGTLIGVIFLGGIIISAFSSIFSSGTESDTSSPPTSPSSTSIAQTAPTPEPKLPGSQWSYHQSNDAMGKGAIYQAQVSSSNTVDFDFPYSGAQHASLTLRIHPRYGKDIIFSIEKGQFLCHSYEDCTVLVRFDDEQAVNYTAVGAADNSTETIFIRNYGRFVEKMLKAKRVRIATNIYQQGAPVFEFGVSGFDQNKYKPKK
jgi:zinc-ribbon domain